jgi:hypothetical protein
MTGMTDHQAQTAQGLTRRAALPLLLAGATLGAASTANASTAALDTRYAALLGRHVRPVADGLNRVAYARWKASRADMTELADIVTGYQAVRPSTLGRQAQFAFWANLYNALTLKVVLDAFPVRTIRSIGVGGPWRRRLVTVEDRPLSLDDIEHRTLRRQWREPRVHYAVNCASVGCPNLIVRPWAAASLDADLDRAARAFVNSPRAVQVIAPRRVRVSSIYHWFKEDFGGNDAGVLAHLRTHANADLRARLDGAVIAGHDYDWSLNGV